MAGLWLAVVFFVLFVMAIAWLAMVSSLFDHLKGHHPATYAEMGEPSLFGKNTPSTNLHLLKFVFSNRYRALADDWLSKRVPLMRGLLAVYLVGLAGWFWLFTIVKSQN